MWNTNGRPLHGRAERSPVKQFISKTCGLATCPQFGLVNWRCYKFYTTLWSLRCTGK